MVMSSSEIIKFICIDVPVCVCFWCTALLLTICLIKLIQITMKK